MPAFSHGGLLQICLCLLFAVDLAFPLMGPTSPVLSLQLHPSKQIRLAWVWRGCLSLVADAQG